MPIRTQSFGLICFALFSLLFGFSALAQNIDTLYNPQGGIYQIIRQDSLTKQVDEYDGGGRLKRQINFLGDVRHGSYKEFQSSGDIKLSATYHRGLLVGEYREYRRKALVKRFTYRIDSASTVHKSVKEGVAEYYYEGEVLRSKGNFQNDLQEGVWEEFNRYGKLIKKTTYAKGKRAGLVEEYYPSGLVSRRRQVYDDIQIGNTKYPTVVQGWVEDYFKNGKKKQEAEYKDGKATGNRRRWKEDGKLYEEAERFGENQLLTKFYDENGNVTIKHEQKIIMKNGYPKYIDHGIIERFQNGVLTSKESYKDGLQHGVFEQYFLNGQLERRSTWKNGNRIGKDVSYFENGNLRSEANYSEIENWNGSFKYVATGWSRSFNENGLEKETYADREGKFLYSAYYSKEGSLISKSYGINGAEWYMSFYPNGKLHVERMRLAGVWLEERFLINGEPYYFDFLTPGTKGKIHITLYDSKEHFDIKDDFRENPLALDQYISNPNETSFYQPNAKDGNYRSHYRNGNPRMEFGIKDKLLQGTFKVYRPGGTVAYELFINEGVVEEINIQLNENGDTTLISRKGKGKASFSKRIFDDGETEIIENDSHGKEIYYYKTYKGGKPKTLRDQRKKVEKTWYEDGTLSSESRPTKHDSLVWEVTNYHPNGKLYYQYFLKDKKKEGLYVSYHKNGQLSAKAIYENNLRNGPYEAYFEDGKLLSKGAFVNDKREGMWKISRDGVVQEEMYKNDKRFVRLSDKNCACIDTSKAISRGFFNALSSFLAYKKYQRYNFDFLADIDSSIYTKLFLGRFSRSSGKSGHTELALYRKFSLYFNDAGTNGIVLNPCHVYGYRSSVPLNYWVNSNDSEEREVVFNVSKVDFFFKNRSFKQEEGNQEIRLQMEAKEVNFNTKSYITFDKEVVDFCFDPIQRGKWSLESGQGRIIPNMPMKDFRRIHHTYSPQEVLNEILAVNPMQKQRKSAFLQKRNTGVLFVNGKGNLAVKGKTVPLTTDFLVIGDQWSGGRFFIGIDAYDGKAYTITTVAGNTLRLGQSQMITALEKSGFKNVRLHPIADQNTLQINFFNLEP